jgi:hypothetical protein
VTWSTGRAACAATPAPVAAVDRRPGAGANEQERGQAAHLAESIQAAPGEAVEATCVDQGDTAEQPADDATGQAAARPAPNTALALSLLTRGKSEQEPPRNDVFLSGDLSPKGDPAKVVLRAVAGNVGGTPVARRGQAAGRSLRGVRGSLCQTGARGERKANR